MFSVPACVSQEWYVGHTHVVERSSHAACHTPSSILPFSRAPLGETAHLSDSVTTGAVWDCVYFCPPLHCQLSYKLQMASQGKVSECNPLLLVMNLTHYRVTEEERASVRGCLDCVGLRVCLRGSIQILLIEIGRSDHRGWHHSLDRGS